MCALFDVFQRVVVLNKFVGHLERGIDDGAQYFVLEPLNYGDAGVPVGAPKLIQYIET